jgi:hypothetical protein
VTTIDEQAVREIARRASLAIRSCGFVKRQYGDTSVGFCALGALSYASDWLTARGRVAVGAPRLAAIARVARLIADDPNDEQDAIMLWNDSAERTKKDVISILDRVAAGEGAS